MEHRRMRLDPENLETQVCPLCGTQLRSTEASSALAADGELLTTIAQHRCAPRLRVPDARPARDVRSG
jgi:hypothetical protein